MKQKHLGVNLTPEHLAQLKGVAEARGLTVSVLVRGLITAELARPENRTAVRRAKAALKKEAAGG
jgi:hypothetical protein